MLGRSLLLLAILATPAVAQKSPTSALINEALDQQINLQLNTTLPRALNAIADQTGVRLEATRDVWAALPWGEQTNVSANIENTTLRAGVESISRKLGLTTVLTDDRLELRPLPALSRVGRRATADELNALDLLATAPLSDANDSATIKQLLTAIDTQLAKSDEAAAGYAIENRFGLELNDRPVTVRRGATLYDALEAITAQTEATWHPDGRKIVVLAKEDQVRAQLQKKVTRNYADVPIGQTLTELSQLAGIEFTIEPGAFQRIAPEFRNVKLLLDNASIEQALQHIAAFTGLGYVVNARGVYFWAASTGTSRSEGRDPIIAMIEVAPGVTVIVPQSQVDPEVRDRLRTMTIEKLEALKNPPPTTAPVAGK